MSVIVTFLLQIAAGSLLFLLPAPRRDLRPSFFWTNALIATIGWLLAAVLEATTAAGAQLAVSPSFWGAVALGVAYVSMTLAGRVDAAWWLLWPAAGLGCWLLVDPAAHPVLSGAGLSTMHAASRLAGALLVGCAIVTMNLGHWYLISSNLSFKWLVRFAMLFTGVVALRGVLVAVFLGRLRALPDAVDPQAAAAIAALFAADGLGVFTVMRVLAGILLPLALAVMIVATARMRSNQSCTGLLYVALVLILIGELTGGFLTRVTSLPL